MPGRANAAQSNYILGWSDAEQDRLIRQATLLAPMTERLFREAGIGAGQRVLDIGSGVGDVAMITARLVGPSGEVVAIERNADYIARARERISALGLRNVTFIRADLNDVAVTEHFDAAVGRNTACRWRSSATSTRFPIVSTPTFSRRTPRSRMSRW